MEEKLFPYIVDLLIKLGDNPRYALAGGFESRLSRHSRLHPGCGNAVWREARHEQCQEYPHPERPGAGCHHLKP